MFLKNGKARTFLSVAKNDEINPTLRSLFCSSGPEEGPGSTTGPGTDGRPITPAGITAHKQHPERISRESKTFISS